MQQQTQLAHGTLLRGGTYRIVKTLGQGGFGITYLAIHELLDKRVAVKEFFPKDFCNRDSDTSRVSVATVSNAELVERLRAKFIKEARNIARFDHPNIVKVHDVFEENDTAYYVMDFIDGESLADIIDRRGTLPLDESLAYIRKVGAAVEYIHGRHLNHLDIKPANIMVRAADNEPLLIDFGLAKQYDVDGNGTTTGTVGRTPGYAPLEQYSKGGVSTFTPQTDVYALGATLYKMLTGVTPPEATELASGRLDIPATIPARIAAAIRKAMAPGRDARHASVAAFLAELAAPKVAPIPSRPTDDTEVEVVGVEPAGVEPAAPKSGSSLWSNMMLTIGLGLISVMIAVIMVSAVKNCSGNHDYRSEPRHLDLAASKGGQTYYFTQSEWQNVSDKSSFSKKGVVVIGNGQRFILALHHSSDITWDEAMSAYGNRLPTKSQAEAMAADYKAINAAITAFGGDEDPNRVCWTRTEDEDLSSYAWVVYMDGGFVYFGIKTASFWARAVAPVPVSAM